MAYTPTEWKTGDVITAPKLNNIEQGIVNAGGDSAGGIVFVTITSDGSGSYTVDKSPKEIITAVNNGALAVAKYENEVCMLPCSTLFDPYEGEYVCVFVGCSLSHTAGNDLYVNTSRLSISQPQNSEQFHVVYQTDDFRIDSSVLK